MSPTTDQNVSTTLSSQFSDSFTTRIRYSLGHAFILERRPGEVYVHYADTDKRLDEWISESIIRILPSTAANTPPVSTPDPSGSRKRKRGSVERDSALPEDSRASSEIRVDNGEGASASVAITEEEYDIEHHKQITAKRNFDKVIFGRWQIKTWYIPFTPSSKNP